MNVYGESRWLHALAILFHFSTGAFLRALIIASHAGFG